jgi:hypothetical protein
MFHPASHQRTRAHVHYDLSSPPRHVHSVFVPVYAPLRSFIPSCMSLSLCPSVSRSLSLSHCLSVSLSLCLNVSLSISLSLSLYICHARTRAFVRACVRATIILLQAAEMANNGSEVFLQMKLPSEREYHWGTSAYLEEFDGVRT